MNDILVIAVGGIMAYLLSGLRVLREYERAVYFFLGRSWGAKGPGLIFLPPLFAKMQKVSLRVMALDIPPQDVITRDNISIKVNAVLYMRVKDTVTTTHGTDGRALVVVVSRDAHDEMIRIFFAMKIWVLQESFVVRG